MSDPLSTLPLSGVRVFEAAARLNSFTRAAEELGMTQAAVSWQVKALERRLGQTLFKRLPREVVPTPAGERLAGAATRAIALLSAAVADITETAEGVLSVTTMQTFAIQWLARRIGAFQIDNPQIALRVDTSPGLSDLSRENLDVAIRSGTGSWPGLEAVYLFPSEFTPLCSPETLERLGGLSHPRDLLGATRIGDRAWWDRWFSRVGVPPPDRDGRAFVVADLQQVEVASAMEGQGVALGSPIFYAREIAAGRLVQPFQETAAWSQGYWIAYLEERRRSPKITRFRDWLLAEAAADPAVPKGGPPRPGALTG
ncbi:MAG TPA: LysR substrate-binding domain-containing protein [Caulobacteraceae bacterium]|nr:LysR substrate-binding domain-containing protein [Caulobacteraceae bacterium]